MTNKFKEELRKWRGSRSQALTANSLDVNLATYRNWEQGRNKPTAFTLSAINSAIKKIDNSSKVKT